MLGDIILYSHDFSDWESVDITKRNLMLITIAAQSIKQFTILYQGHKIYENFLLQN